MGRPKNTVDINQNGRIDVVHHVSDARVLAALDDDIMADIGLHSNVKRLKAGAAQIEGAIDV